MTTPSWGGDRCVNSMGQWGNGEAVGKVHKHQVIKLHTLLSYYLLIIPQCKRRYTTDKQITEKEVSFKGKLENR